MAPWGISHCHCTRIEGPGNHECISDVLIVLSLIGSQEKFGSLLFWLHECFQPAFVFICVCHFGQHFHPLW